MARALLEAGIRPDLLCGTSIGAINGAPIALGEKEMPQGGWTETASYLHVGLSATKAQIEDLVAKLICSDGLSSGRAELVLISLQDKIFLFPP